MHLKQSIKLCITLVVVWLLLGSKQVFSEAIDEQKVPIPMVMGIKHYAYGRAEIGNSAADLSMDYTHLMLPLGRFNVGDHFLIPTLSLEQTEFAVGNGFDAAGNPSLYTIKSQFMFIKKLDNQWTRIIQVTPSLHTDGDVVDEEGFSLMGLALWRYESTDYSGWTMGVGANRLFGEYLPIPLIAYQYRPSEYSQIDIGFPVTKYEHRWHRDWTGFMAVKPVGGNWRFKSAEDKEVNVSYSSWVASAGIRYELKPKIWATLEVGNGLSRKFDIDTDDESGKADIGESSIMMFSIGLHP